MADRVDSGSSESPALPPVGVRGGLAAKIVALVLLVVLAQLVAHLPIWQSMLLGLSHTKGQNKMMV